MADDSNAPDSAEKELFGDSAPAATQSAPAVTPDIDAVVRTAYAEAPKGGWGAVAGVIRNRSDASGKGYGAVIAEPNAFEGYNNDRYKSLKAGSPQYQAVLSEVMPVLQGGENPAGAADAYYSPTGQKAKGRAAPDWSVGKQPVASIGGNTFYSGVYRPTAPSADAGSEQELFGNGSPTHLSPANSPVTAEALPAAEVRPRKLEQSDAYMGLDGRGKPVFDPSFRGLQNGGPEANFALPSTDPDLPPVPKGYYWPEGTELGADGKPHFFTAGVYDPNQKERFNPEALANELERERLAMTPSGQMALAQAANAPDPSHPNDSGVLGHAANGAMQGFLPQVNGAIGYGLQSGQNLINSLTGRPITVRAADAAAAERLGTRALLGEESAYHPLTAPVAELGGSLATALPAIEGATGLVRSAPRVGAFLAGDAGAGSGVRNLLWRAASRGSSGALQGAEAGALTSGLSDRPLGDNVLTGAVAGGALGGGGSLAYDTAKGTLSAGRAALQPFSEEGRNQIVADTLRKFAEGGPTDLNLTQYVPGAPSPTLAQATGNRGLSAVEKAVRAGNPTINNAFDSIARQAQDAREAAIDALKGDGDSLDRLRAIRSAQADPIREQAFANAQPVDPSPVLKTIDDILASPSGKRDAVVKALQSVRGKIATDVPGLEGVKALEQDPAQLYGVRQAITDMLTPTAQKDASSSQLAARELGQVKSALDDVIEQGAPGYQKYLKTYSDLSRPIDEQLFLQGKTFTNANGQVTMAKVKSVQDALDRAELTPGTSKAKNVSDATREGLDKLYADLQRESASSPDRNLGSNTFQNIATNNLMAKLGVPAALADAAGMHVLPVPGWVAGLGGLAARAAYQSKNPLITEQLGQALLNPEIGGAMLQQQPGNVLRNNPLLVESLARKLAPIGAVSRNLLLAPPASNSVPSAS